MVGNNQMSGDCFLRKQSEQAAGSDRNAEGKSLAKKGDDTDSAAWMFFIQAGPISGKYPPRLGCQEDFGGNCR
jgi:hypothetical protein